jgi:hypothetical protein
MPHHRRQQRGSTLVEFTLVGIPVIFLLISIVEISRGMWLYHTLAHAVKEGTRFAIVHGNNCTIHPNNCTVTIRDISERIRRNAVGFVPDEIDRVRFADVRYHGRDEVTCEPLTECLQAGTKGDTPWPADPADPNNVAGDRGSWLEITARYPFRSATAMFWPGAGRGTNFGVFNLFAVSREAVQY